jgi:aminopeptidase-like protein
MKDQSINQIENRILNLANEKWGFFPDFHLSNTIEYCFILQQKYYTSAELMIDKIFSSKDNHQYKNLLYQLFDHIID